MRPQTFLILHGWGSKAKNWENVKKILEEKGWEVKIPDLPGFGENLTMKKPFSLDDFAEWVKKYTKTQNLNKFFLIGHSFGGAVAVKYCLKYPEDVEKLILVNPALIRKRDFKKKVISKILSFFKIFSFFPFFEKIKLFFCKVFLKSDYYQTSGVLRETYLKIIKEDLSGFLPKLKVKSLIIWGEKDKITPLKYGILIKKLIPQSKFIILKKISHNPHTQSPEILVKSLLNNL